MTPPIIIMRADTAERSVSRPASFFLQSMASTRNGSSSRRARSASVSVNRRCSGWGSCSSWRLSSSSAIRIVFRAGQKLRIEPYRRMLTQTQHAVEGNTREMAGTLVDRDAVYHISGGEIVQRPKEMLGSDAKHGGANANTGI